MPDLEAIRARNEERKRAIADEEYSESAVGVGPGQWGGGPGSWDDIDALLAEVERLSGFPRYWAFECWNHEGETLLERFVAQDAAVAAASAAEYNNGWFVVDVVTGQTVAASRDGLGMFPTAQPETTAGVDPDRPAY